MNKATAPKKKPRRELELEISLLKEKNAELTARLKGLRNARVPISKIKTRIQTIRDYGTMSRIKETTKALPIISRSSHRKNSPPREHDDANSALEERLAKANVLIYQLQSEVSVLRKDVEEAKRNLHTAREQHQHVCAQISSASREQQRVQSLLDAAQETSSRQQKMHQREINKLREQIAALRRQSSASRPEPTPLEGRRTRSSYELFFRVPDSSAAADDGKNEYGRSIMQELQKMKQKLDQHRTGTCSSLPR